MQVTIYKNEPTPCPYLKDRECISYFFQVPHMEGQLYEHLMSDGWRRCGLIFYKNTCHECQECVPIRIRVKDFTPSKSQRKTWRKNDDITVKVARSDYQEEDFELYNHYYQTWHKSENTPSRDEYLRFLASPLDSRIIRFYQKDKLVGLSWIDLLHDAISSIYFAFLPELRQRRLGVFSMLWEISLCEKLEKSFLYTGFYIKGCPKMSYKAEYHPAEIAVNGQWKLL